MNQAVSIPGAREGWSAALRLRFAPRSGQTVLVCKQHDGPLLVQRPFYPEGGLCHVYVLHPPAGVVGGDRLTLTATLAPGAQALLTTPGATRLYRSAGEQAVLDNRFELGEGSSLEWLPQDTIVFPGALADMQTRFDLSDGARLMAWDCLCLGRPVMNEPFDHGRLQTRLAVYREGKPVLHERLRIADGDLYRLGGVSLHAMMVVTPADETCLTLARTTLDVMDVPAGVTVMSGASLVDGVLVVRWLGDDNISIQHQLQRLWCVLRPAILDRPACLPRIWAT